LFHPKKAGKTHALIRRLYPGCRLRDRFRRIEPVANGLRVRWPVSKRVISSCASDADGTLIDRIEAQAWNGAGRY
jgi:hypothetical protein